MWSTATLVPHASATGRLLQSLPDPPTRLRTGQPLWKWIALAAATLAAAAIAVALGVVIDHWLNITGPTRALASPMLAAFVFVMAAWASYLACCALAETAARTWMKVTIGSPASCRRGNEIPMISSTSVPAK